MFRQRRLRASFQHFSLLHGPRQLRCQFSGSCQRIARCFADEYSSKLLYSTATIQIHHRVITVTMSHSALQTHLPAREIFIPGRKWPQWLQRTAACSQEPAGPARGRLGLRSTSVSLQERPVPQRGSISLVSRQACLYRAGLCRPEKFRLFRIG
ncbi:uncharacterized protein [Dermacentor andersoni]|uniref:uncharacterized protein isoform X2 n=1 Tax=Dermacentor andersoni TaxID=34620 RepID=UPI0024164D18|nr:uncharacterized protein LOC129387234 isoform X2 [Dermacentor andersoni]